MTLIHRATAIALAAAFAVSSLPAQAPAPKLAPPVRLKAGDKFLGEGRLYPSPVLHDMNGDGLPDIVVGDLWGHLTVALRLAGDGPPRYGAETKVMASDGKELDFHNW